MIKIGVVDIDTSHPLGFAEVLEKSNLDLRYEMVYNDGFRGLEEVDWFVKRFGLKGKVDSIEDMVDQVDVGFIQSCNWEKHLSHAMHFINKGKPVFLDKPLVGSMEDIIKIEKLVEDGAKIIGSSSLRYAKEIQEFLAKPIEERGEIVSIFGTCGVDEFNYGIHIVEGFSALVGCKGKSCQYIGKGVQNGEECEMYTVEFENGVRGVYYSYLKRWHPFHITVMTTKSTYTLTIDSSQIYLALLEAINDLLINNQDRIADIYTLTNCTKIMLCGKKSRDEKNGEVVTVDELTKEDKFDGYAFEKKYGDAASIIYKD